MLTPTFYLWPRDGCCAGHTVGLVVAVGALRGYDLGEFAGWQYVRRAVLPAAPLHTASLDVYVRHPLYLGVLLLLAEAWLLVPTAPRAVFGLMMWACVRLGLRAEEAKLTQASGAACRTCQQQVSAL